MKKLFALTAFSLLVITLFGQGKDREKMDPSVTEVWEPMPEVVSFKNNIPSDAIILFDGSNFDHWESLNGKSPGWTLEDGAMTVKPGTGGIKTKESFSDFQMHIEWRSPSVVKGEGQGRGNSGIFLMGKYELQVLDNYNNVTYPNGQASSIYKQSIPLVNACKAPGVWQTYDIIFTAPRFNEKGRKTRDAKITVLHNGVLTLNNASIWGPTQYKGLPQDKAHGDGPIHLQDHSDLVSFRNIWIRKL